MEADVGEQQKSAYQDTHKCVMQPRKSARNTMGILTGRKNVFIHAKLHGPYSKAHDFLITAASHLRHFTFLISVKSLYVFMNYKPSKSGLIYSRHTSMGTHLLSTPYHLSHLQ